SKSMTEESFQSTDSSIHSSPSKESLRTTTDHSPSYSLLSSPFVTELMHSADTVVLPSIQIPFLDFIQHKILTSNILCMSKTNSLRVHLSTAYFNPTERYIRLLSQFPIRQQSSTLAIFTSGPTANGFWNSKGLSKYIPSAYQYLLSSFCLKFC